MISVADRRRPVGEAGGTYELVTTVHDVMKGFTRRLSPELAEEGISMGQFWALHLISSLGSASMSSMARHLSVSAPTVCASIDQLEAAGLVSRRRSETDRRAVQLRLTAHGRRTEARLWGRVGELMHQSAADVPPEDVAAAVRVFRALQQRLDQDGRSGEDA